MATTRCERCQGNGEIITDWERYLEPEPGDAGDEATADCPDCAGLGRIECQQTDKEFPATTSGEEPPTGTKVSRGKTIIAGTTMRAAGLETEGNGNALPEMRSGHQR